MLSMRKLLQGINRHTQFSQADRKKAFELLWNTWKKFPNHLLQDTLPRNPLPQPWPHPLPDDLQRLVNSEPAAGDELGPLSIAVIAELLRLHGQKLESTILGLNHQHPAGLEIRPGDVQEGVTWLFLRGKPFSTAPGVASRDFLQNDLRRRGLYNAVQIAATRQDGMGPAQAALMGMYLLQIPDGSFPPLSKRLCKKLGIPLAERARRLSVTGDSVPLLPWRAQVWWTRNMSEPF